MDLIENLQIEPINYWYYRYKFIQIYSALRRFRPGLSSLADIGAGSAVFSRELVNRLPNLSVNAVDPFYSVSDLRKEISGIVFSTKLKENDFEVFLLTDVLEHVERDCLFLKEHVDLAKEGALFIITVPAMPKLWSGHDVYLKHYRRYSRDSLTETIEQANLSLKKINYLYSTVYPIIRIKRILDRHKTRSNLQDLPPLLNSILRRAIMLDRLFSPWAWWGVSLIAVAEKKSSE
jgi:hypothetical protein